MPHQKMRFHLPHGVQHDPNRDQHARTTKELGNMKVDVEHLSHDDWDYRNDRKENGPGQSDPAHGSVQKVAGCHPRPHTRYVTTMLLEIIRDLQLIELGGDPEVTEEQDHSRIKDQVKCRPL